MKVKKLIFLTTIVMLISCGSFAKTYSPPNEFKKVNKFMARLTQEGFSGAVLIAQNGKISSNGYGYADREKKIKATPNTVFSTGSVTKQFTGAAILKLEMQGKLSVQDKLSKYFKVVPADKKNITIHQLLTHSAGFPDAIGNDFEFLSKEDYLKRAFERDLMHAPGNTYEYSNVGFSILAAIIEQVSGDSYEKYLHENLFVPAEMNNTGYSIPKWSDEKISVGYASSEHWGKMTERYQNKAAQLWNLKGNGGILSTVEDLYKWHLALNGNKVLNEEAKEKYFTPHIREYPDGEQYYGYGWVVLETQNHGKLIKHNGGNGIFFTDFWRLPKEDTTIIMMTNSLKGEYSMLVEEIYKMLFNPEYISTLSTKIDKKYSDLEKHPHGKLIQAFLATILKKNVAKNEEFIKANFHPSLLKSVAAERMAKGLTNLGDEIKGHEIDSIEDKKNLVILKYKGSPLKLMLTIKDEKIAGIDVEN